MTKVAAVTSKSAKRLLDFQQNNGYLNDVRLESFGFFLDDYVIYGGDLTFDTVDVYKVLLSESIISLNDQLWRAFIKEFRITKHNTTYYVGFLDEKGYVFGETEPFENYLRLWTIPVDANGNIGSLIDHRSLFGYLKFKAKYNGVYLNVDEVNEAINNANSAADNANQAASDVQGAVDGAKRATEKANEAVLATEEALENVNSSLNQLEEVVVDARTAIGETKTATTNANQAAQAADSARNNLSNAVSEKLNEVDDAIESANDAATVATQAAENIKGWGLAVAWNATTTFEKNNMVTDNGSTWQAKKQNTNSRPSLNNTDWILIAQRGIDGTGAVSSVNGILPDPEGNVQLDLGSQTLIPEKSFAEGSNSYPDGLSSFVVTSATAQGWNDLVGASATRIVVETVNKQGVDGWTIQKISYFSYANLEFIYQRIFNRGKGSTWQAPIKMFPYPDDVFAGGGAYDLMLSDKVVDSDIFKSVARLMHGKTNGVYSQLKESVLGSGIYDLLEVKVGDGISFTQIMNYQLTYVEGAVTKVDRIV